MTEFMDLSAIAEADMNSTLYGDSQPFSLFYDQVAADLKTVYEPLHVCNGATVIMTSCAFSNFTNSQWLDSTILSNPLPDQAVTSTGYVENYRKYATGFINPEYGFWKVKNDVEVVLSEA